MSYDKLPEVLLTTVGRPDAGSPDDDDNGNAMLWVNGRLVHWCGRISYSDICDIAIGLAEALEVELVEVNLPDNFTAVIPLTQRSDQYWDYLDEGDDAFSTVEVEWWLHNVWLPSAEAARAEREAYGRAQE